jgi:hypothetical protein
MTDIALEGKWTQTATGDSFLFFDDTINQQDASYPLPLLRTFTLIKNKIAYLVLVFLPTSPMAYFETAVHSSIREVFPDINTKGCFFHFNQRIWRKAQATGLQIPYRDNDDVKTLVRRAAILPLLPHASVEEVCFQAIEDRDNTDITQLTQPFTDYVTD